MICPTCTFENPSDAKFCQNCGSTLERKCLNCGTINAASAKFCKQCGNRLDTKPGVDSLTREQERRPAPPSADPRLARLVANTPTALAEKIRSVAHLSGERRVVTALFADVVGSTELAAHMDPEDWTEVMNQAFDLLVPAVYMYEGTIARLMGDGLLAFFGAPVAHEDDPIRAAHAALEIVSTTRRYAEEVRRIHGIDFAIRVGLSTGPVVVGDVGSNLVYEYTAMGDAINLAARLQSAARPMTVLIAENTYRFITPVFECRDLGKISIKGKSDLIQIYEVVKPKSKPGKMRGIQGLESPMVGRHAELNALLHLADVVRAGLGRAALILGEAGLGKSRLIAEWKALLLKKETEIAPLEWIEGHCLSYGQGLAYHLLIDLLRSTLGLIGKPSGDESYTRLLQMIKDLVGGQAEEITPFIGHLLSLPLEPAVLERIRLFDPQSLQNKYLSAIRRILLANAAQQPLILVCEDLHWADPSSVELLTKLLPLANEVPILFCFLTRPDMDAPGWRLINATREQMGNSLVEVQLHSLSEEDSRQLVANLLEIEALPENIRTIILKKAEGNPFFVEEIIRMLIDREIVVQRDGGWMAEGSIDMMDIPDNLQSLLLARIDRLPDEVKRTLRVASVIGRRFSLQVLEQVLARQGRQ